MQLFASPAAFRQLASLRFHRNSAYQAAAPFETRFTKEAKLIDEYDLSISEYTPNCRVFIIYDSLDELDKKHVDMISHHIDLVGIDLPNSGHSSTKAMADLKLLDSLFSFGENNDDYLAQNIRDVFNKKGHMSAFVLATKARRLPPVEQKSFLLNLPDTIIGIKSSREILDKLKQDA